MTDKSTRTQGTGVEAKARRKWGTPTLTNISAGRAELGAAGSPDGSGGQS